jgi:exopolyphosphatase / guanosine-5'-triphosphate,3'-diphosphate pyrophosphatase
MAYRGGGAGQVPRSAQKPQRDAGPPVMGRPRFPMRKTYAALDLGTNNCRMLIARPEGEGFVIVDAFSRIVRLGEGLTKSGRLSDAAMERTIAALSICAAKLQRRGVDLSHAVATEACRRAHNGMEFVARIERETGLRLNVINPEGEARLAVLGCYRMLDPAKGPAVIFDIGGGSTELVIVEAGEAGPVMKDWVSIPWGVVSLAEAIFTDQEGEAERLEAYEAMKAEVRPVIEQFAARNPLLSAQPQLLGTSGTVTTLASVFLGLERYDRSKVDGLTVPSASLRAISHDLARQSIAGRAGMPCIGQERADLVVAGCAILDAVLDVWPTETVGVADRGIREGILRELFRMGGHETMGERR